LFFPGCVILFHKKNTFLVSSVFFLLLQTHTSCITHTFMYRETSTMYVAFSMYTVEEVGLESVIDREKKRACHTANCYFIIWYYVKYVHVISYKHL
jgi:hypothetical protein